MAKKSASAGGKGFHKPAYDGALRGFTLALITDARSGRLKVCNRFGTYGMPDEIIKDSKLEGPIVEVESDANLTIALNVFVGLPQLNAWAKERGDVFHINHKNAPWIDGRGWNNVDGEQPTLQFTVEPMPASAPQSRPIVAVPAFDGLKLAKAAPGWSLKTSLERAPGYRWPLYQVLKAAHVAGQPCPKARDVLEIWKQKPPPDVEVMTDGVKYNDGLGKPKEANLKAIQQAIKNLTI